MVNNINRKQPIHINYFKNKKLKKATDGFEAIYVKKMLEVAFKHSSIGGNGPGKNIIKDMYLDNLSKAGSGSIGISKMLYENIIRNSNK